MTQWFSRLVKRIHSLSLFKRKDANLEIDKVLSLVSETRTLCEEMKSFAFLVEITKAQQAALLGMGDQISVYERILEGKSYIVTHEEMLPQ